ncbi:L,D-transpeptidase family protein [Phenylobacterium immobile]|uniref:L,D-transpeptidase family protein n=1 Tax=Phenylobacterium immobile TaxID=21 RepID=UPI000B1C7A46|nr:L,D-transpeptidase [Phenylobacterium immobile]
MNTLKLSSACLFAILAACSQPAPAEKSPPASSAAAVAASPAPPPLTASTADAAKAIDTAQFAEAMSDNIAKRDVLIRAQVLLDRAHVSPGVIDGQLGGNFTNALAAYERSRNLPADGKLDAQVWTMLLSDARPTVMDYVITAEDAAGPFIEAVPKDYSDMAKLDRLAYTSPAEALAEKFHMDEALLRALNPAANFAVAGTTILVAAAGAAAVDPVLPKVAAIEVDKSKQQLRAYDDKGGLIAVYPATVGSSERPAPSGVWAVRTLAPAPTYTFDPDRVTFGDASKGKLTIAAGPNNPVGSTWIDLTKDTYGIHGTPDPRLVGKVASHGCVRLTNWDAAQLGAAVHQGTKVTFVGAEAD